MVSLVILIAYYPVHFFLHCVPKNVHLFIFENDFFLISQGKVATGIQVRLANVQAFDVKFSQDLTQQKSLKSVNF